MSDQVKQLQQNFKLWLTAIEASKLVKSIDILPEDSISITTSGISWGCFHGAVSSAGVNAAAGQAILKAEAATLRRLRQIEEEKRRVALRF